MNNDPLSTAHDAQGLCGGIHTATLCTNDLRAIRDFYVTGMGMELVGPLEISDQVRTLQHNLWGLERPISYQYYHLHRATIPSLIQLRVIVPSTVTPMIHHSYSSIEIGSFSLGFPNGDQRALDTKLRTQGIEAMAPLQEDQIARPDGTSYPYLETIFKGPDYVHCVGIERGGGMSQLAPIDNVTKLGGPGYSAFVTDRSDEELAFYTQVLGMELRADRYWEAAEDGALGIPAGVSFRFSLVYAPGTTQNHMLFLDYQDGIFEQAAAPFRIPNRGLSMWTFETSEMNQILQNATQHQIEIIAQHITMVDPINGLVNCSTLLTPTGFLIEIFEKL